MYPHIIEVKRLYDVYQYIFSCEESMCWTCIIYSLSSNVLVVSQFWRWTSIFPRKCKWKILREIKGGELMMTQWGKVGKNFFEGKRGSGVSLEENKMYSKPICRVHPITGWGYEVRELGDRRIQEKHTGDATHDMSIKYLKWNRSWITTRPLNITRRKCSGASIYLFIVNYYLVYSIPYI